MFRMTLITCAVVAALFCTHQASAQMPWSSTQGAQFANPSGLLSSGCATGNCGGDAYSSVVSGSPVVGGCSDGSCGGIHGGAGLGGGGLGGGRFGFADRILRVGHVPKQTQGRRTVLKMLVDDDFTRTISLYGGGERFFDDLDDVFAGGTDVNNNYVAGIEVGRRHTANWRSAFDLTVRENELSANPTPGAVVGGDLSVYSILKNVYYDFRRPCEKFRPYAGLGIGYAHLDGTANSPAGDIEIEDGDFAWQVIAGASYKISTRASLIGEYRYFDTGNVGIAPTLDGSYSSNNLLFGIRFGY